MNKHEELKKILDSLYDDILNRVDLAEIEKRIMEISNNDEFRFYLIGKMVEFKRGLLEKRRGGG